MKSIIALILAALLAVTVCALLAQNIINTCEDLIEEKERIVQAVRLGDFDLAMEGLVSLRDHWMQVEGPWEMVCDHDDLNAVTEAITGAIIMCDYRDAPLLEIECTKIELALFNIMHKESFTVRNVV